MSGLLLVFAWLCLHGSVECAMSLQIKLSSCELRVRAVSVHGKGFLLLPLLFLSLLGTCMVFVSLACVCLAFRRVYMVSWNVS